jgi:hypothetical protein
MYVCMYVCMYVHMYVCMYVCMYICMYVCMYVCICTHARAASNAALAVVCVRVRFLFLSASLTPPLPLFIPFLPQDAFNDNDLGVAGAFCGHTSARALAANVLAPLCHGGFHCVSSFFFFAVYMSIGCVRVRGKTNVLAPLCHGGFHFVSSFLFDFSLLFLIILFHHFYLSFILFHHFSLVSHCFFLSFFILFLLLSESNDK